MKHFPPSLKLWRAGRNLLLVVCLVPSLGACSLLAGGLMGGLFGDSATVEDIQQSRTARQVHLAVAGMFEAIVTELTAMLADGTLAVERGQQVQPWIEVGRTALRASDAFLLQAAQQRELGRTTVAASLERKAFAQLRTANANLDMLRAVHLGAVETAPTPAPTLRLPPLLAAPPQPLPSREG